MRHQKGILEHPQKHADILTFDLKDRAAAEALEALWTDLNERLLDWHSGANLTVTIGFGLPLFEKVGRLDRKPRALKLMPGWEGDAFKPKDTQHDLIVQVCRDERSVNNHVQKAVLKQLGPGFTLRSDHIGFGLPESRGVLGFVTVPATPRAMPASPSC